MKGMLFIGLTLLVVLALFFKFVLPKLNKADGETKSYGYDQDFGYDED